MKRNIFAVLGVFVLFVAGGSLAVSLLPQEAVAAEEVVPHGGLFRFPDVSDRFIAFVYADDLWIAGLPKGVRIITVGQGFVRPGEPVKPVAEDDAAGAANSNQAATKQ